MKPGRGETEEDIVDLYDWCGRHNLAAIPYGGGTSVVGGVNPPEYDRYRGVVTIDLKHFDKVLEVDAKSQSARIQAGVLGPSLEKQLKPTGLTMRFFLQAWEFSSLGGWIATRAAGHFATAYTQIDDHVQSLKVVTPSGNIESRRFPVSGSGPNPDRLFLGSEGALGIITEAWVRLHRRPVFRKMMSDRPRYAPPFYALSWSYVDYLVPRVGLEGLQAAATSPEGPDLGAMKPAWLAGLAPSQ